MAVASTEAEHQGWDLPKKKPFRKTNPTFLKFHSAFITCTTSIRAFLESSLRVRPRIGCCGRCRRRRCRRRRRRRRRFVFQGRGLFYFLFFTSNGVSRRHSPFEGCGRRKQQPRHRSGGSGGSGGGGGGSSSNSSTPTSVSLRKESERIRSQQQTERR